MTNVNINTLLPKVGETVMFFPDLAGSSDAFWYWHTSPHMARLNFNGVNNQVSDANGFYEASINTVFPLSVDVDIEVTNNETGVTWWQNASNPLYPEYQDVYIRYNFTATGQVRFTIDEVYSGKSFAQSVLDNNGWTASLPDANGILYKFTQQIGDRFTDDQKYIIDVKVNEFWNQDPPEKPEPQTPQEYFADIPDFAVWDATQVPETYVPDLPLTFEAPTVYFDPSDTTNSGRWSYASDLSSPVGATAETPGSGDDGLIGALETVKKPLASILQDFVKSAAAGLGYSAQSGLVDSIQTSQKIYDMLDAQVDDLGKLYDQVLNGDADQVEKTVKTLIKRPVEFFAGEFKFIGSFLQKEVSMSGSFSDMKLAVHHLNPSDFAEHRDIWVGSSRSESLSFGSKADLGAGGGGEDRLSGQKGNDILLGGSGGDTLLGGGGKDYLNGGDDADRMIGGSGDDVLRGGNDADIAKGGAGSDRLIGDSGDDRLLGGKGNDMLIGASGDDTLLGGTGRDKLRGGSEEDRLLGQGGNDRLEGGAGNDDLRGGAGRDVLIGGEGIDLMIGGAGNDRFLFDFGDVLDGGGGADRYVLVSTEVPQFLEDSPPYIYGLNESEGDKLDLRIFGGLEGVESFSSGGRAEVRVTPDRVLIDIDGDGLVDRTIMLASSDAGLGELIL